MSGFWSGLIGALVGGGLTALGVVLAASIAQRGLDRRQRRATRAKSITAKRKRLHRWYARIFDLTAAFEELVADTWNRKGDPNAERHERTLSGLKLQQRRVDRVLALVHLEPDTYKVASMLAELGTRVTDHLEQYGAEEWGPDANNIAIAEARDLDEIIALAQDLKKEAQIEIKAIDGELQN